MRLASLAALALLAAVGSACADRYAGAGPLEAEKAILERELAGLRESAERLDRGDPVLPANDMLIAIDEAFVQRLVAARLPIDVTSGPYTVTLTHVEVGFSGAPAARLRGTIARDGVVALEATVGLIAALSDIEIDQTTSTLHAAMTADHLDIERVSGIESFLSGASLDDVARLLRQSVDEQLPTIEIPVRIQDDLDIPPVTSGPIRLNGLRLPIKVVVSRVLAMERRLWISLHVDVGQLGRATP